MKTLWLKILSAVQAIWFVFSGKKLKEIWIETKNIKEAEQRVATLTSQIKQEHGRIDYLREKVVQLINDYTTASNQMSPELVRKIIEEMDVQRN